MSRPAAPVKMGSLDDALKYAEFLEAERDRLATALSLAQTEIKGHMRVEDDLKARIAELEDVRATLKSQMDDWLAENHKTLAARDNAIARADAAQSRIAELEKDAARYRHLRESVTVKDRMFGYCVREWMYQGPCDIATLDAAIDEALKSRA